MDNNMNVDIFSEASIMGVLNGDLLSEGAGIYQENPENDIILAESILEATLSSDELEALCENTSELALLQDENILNEKSIIRFDKNAKLKRAESQAIIIIAREKKDRDLNKLLRVWKMRKILLERLRRKYYNAAKARAKQMVRNLGKSKSNTAKKASNRVS